MNTYHLPGVYPAQKKNGKIYYRSSITYRRKHVSLGSYADMKKANMAYQEAQALLTAPPSKYPEDYTELSPLSFHKWVSLINFHKNGIYIKNPIYLKKGYFIYYLSKDESLIFDIDDLFYYSEHKIMKRNGHLFVSDYGMQVTILSRYGIKSYAVAGRDYLFRNGNINDFRYENIQVINPYNGVQKILSKNLELYQAKIHIKGNYIIGNYPTAEEAAIAYNKAIDIVKAAGCAKNYQPNYIESLTGKKYAEIYSQLTISPKLYSISFIL